MCVNETIRVIVVRWRDANGEWRAATSLEIRLCAGGTVRGRVWFVDDCCTIPLTTTAVVLRVRVSIVRIIICLLLLLLYRRIATNSGRRRMCGGGDEVAGDGVPRSVGPIRRQLYRMNTIMVERVTW